jgi:hypothetical protein
MNAILDRHRAWFGAPAAAGGATRSVNGCSPDAPVVRPPAGARTRRFAAGLRRFLSAW